jgi:hypothetical protein
MNKIVAIISATLGLASGVIMHSPPAAACYDLAHASTSSCDTCSTSDYQNGQVDCYTGETWARNGDGEWILTYSCAPMGAGCGD